MFTENCTIIKSKMQKIDQCKPMYKLIYQFLVVLVFQLIIQKVDMRLLSNIKTQGKVFFFTIMKGLDILYGTINFYNYDLRSINNV